MADFAVSPIVLRPHPWLLALSLAAIVAAFLLVLLAPPPFTAISADGSPSRLLLFLWVALPLAGVLGLWRIATWSTYRAHAEGFETRWWFAPVRRLPWTALTAATLNEPRGAPPSYVLQFGDHEIRLIAAHFDQRAIIALRALVSRVQSSAAI